MAPLLLIKCGTLDEVSPDFVARFGDMEQAFAEGCGLQMSQVHVADVARGAPLPEAGGVSGVIITGSGAMVTERVEWMLRTEAWLRRAVAADLPVLGVCFGHQLLSKALGGDVGENPAGLEAGTVEVRPNVAPDDPLFGEFTGPVFMQVHHYQTVLTLPPGSVCHGASDGDASQLIRHGSRAWSIQFHPEVTAGMMRAILSDMRATHEAEGIDVDALIGRVRDTPQGPVFLRRFVALAGF